MSGPRDLPNATLTAVAGLRVGHAAVPGGGSGVTVILGPFRAAVAVTGMATGSRELGTLAPEHLVPRVDALVLTGGSAFGLAAADGVMAWLAERGHGFDTGAARVPIVPAAVLFDLREGVPRPDAATGRAACEAASGDPVAEGRVGAGAGATVGKLAGPAGATPGGVGSCAVRVGRHVVGALAAVNALGDVLDGDGHIVAGARAPDGTFLDSVALLRAAAEGSGGGEGGEAGGGGEGVAGRDGGEAGEAGASRDGGAFPPSVGASTTLAVVATDAPLSKGDLARLARMAATALPRRIRPVHTPFDGDLVFAVSPSGGNAPLPPAPPLELLALGDAARQALEEAVTRAVNAEPPGGPGA